MRNSALLLIILLFSTVSTLAFADEVNTSSTTPSVDWNNYYFNYFGIYHGAPLDHFNSPKLADQNGNLSKYSSINFDSEITAAYMVAPGIGIGPDIPFNLVPVLGQGIILGDVGIKAFDQETVSYRGFHLYTNLILQAPTSQYSQSRNEQLGVKTTPAFRYTIPGTRFTIGTWNELKDYVGVTTGKQVKVYTEPYVNYRLTSRLSLNLAYEMEWDHNVGMSGIGLQTYQTDLEPGFIWMVTPKIFVNPYLQVFTTNQTSLDTSALGAIIGATL